MRIGIDARMYGPAFGGGGLGRYVEQLVGELQRQDRENRYVLFLKPENAAACRVAAPNFETRVADAHWYTAREQLLLPRLIGRERLDLVHFPHWNVPLLCPVPFVVTIHDLILLEQPRSARASTRHPAIFALKRLGYRTALSHAARRARHVIVPSAYVRDSVRSHFPGVPTDRISVIYEGITTLPPADGPARPGPYVLHVGNAYPHKNLETLRDAFAILSRERPEVSLVVAGRDDHFSRRLREEWRHAPGFDRVTFVPNPTDADLARLYAGAAAYVFPSRSEGFGLPPLEAMAAGVPVVASNASCLPEILGDAALYASPDDPAAFARQLDAVLGDAARREGLIARGRERVTHYSWSAMAAETRAIYERVGHKKNT